jgi:hypothetical protein
MKTIVKVALAAAISCGTGFAAVQDYPNKPI